eukprot:SAG31_NODE_18098_length_647_cov_0.733577_1_plen_64_part_00
MPDRHPQAQKALGSALVCFGAGCYAVTNQVEAAAGEPVKSRKESDALIDAQPEAARKIDKKNM